MVLSSTIISCSGNKIWHLSLEPFTLKNDFYNYILQTFSSLMAKKKKEEEKQGGA